jgi:hypothetical protein
MHLASQITNDQLFDAMTRYYVATLFVNIFLFVILMIFIEAGKTASGRRKPQHNPDAEQEVGGRPPVKLKYITSKRRLSNGPGTKSASG